MGLFDSLFGTKKPTTVEAAAERIWMTTDAKFAGLAREIAERSKSGTVAILLVAHFPDVLARLNELAAKPATVPVMRYDAQLSQQDITFSTSSRRQGANRQ